MLKNLGVYDIGDQPFATMSFRHRVTRELTDPSTVVFLHWLSVGDEVEYVYGVANNVTCDAEGIYMCELLVTVMAGKHYVRCKSTGDAAAADEGQYRVRVSKFATP